MINFSLSSAPYHSTNALYILASFISIILEMPKHSCLWRLNADYFYMNTPVSAIGFNVPHFYRDLIHRDIFII